MDAATLEGPIPTTGAASLPAWKRWYLASECFVVFVAIPVALYFFRMRMRGAVIGTLVVVAIACTTLLVADRRFDKRRMWNAIDFGSQAARSLRRFVIGAALLGMLVWLLRPELLWNLPRTRPTLWLIIMLVYPIVSVFPQELIFRTFFFHRYADVLRRPVMVIVASGIAFGLAHVFFGNWIAPVLSGLGGLLFAETYYRTRSTLQAAIEHALWGDFIFTIGLGSYFFGGAIS